MSFDPSDKAAEAGVQLVRSVWSYFKWDTYFMHRLKAVLDGRPPHAIESEADFWRRTDGHAAESFREGDQAVLRCDQSEKRWWHLCDWVPRMPGELWRQPGAPPRSLQTQFLLDQLKPFLIDYPSAVAMAANIPAYGWNDKTRMCLSGIGSVRLPKNAGNEDYYACMSAVTSQGWLVDAGIPVVVSKSVYEKMSKVREQNNAVEADLRGWVLQNRLSFDLTLLTGNASEQESRLRALEKVPGIQHTYLYVNSPQDCEFRTGGSHPGCNAWTLFRCKQPQHEPGNVDVRDMLRGVGAYGLTYCEFDPASPKSRQDATEFLIQSPRWLELLSKRDPRSLAPKGEEWSKQRFEHLWREWSSLEIDPLTDFDGVDNPMSSLGVIQMGSAATIEGQGLMRDVVDRFAGLFKRPV
jgi:hypothetical protein